MHNSDKIYTLQGGEGDCFYVVGSGEFEVLATQVYKLCHLIALLICDDSTDILLGKYGKLYKPEAKGKGHGICILKTSLNVSFQLSMLVIFHSL